MLEQDQGMAECSTREEKMPTEAQERLLQLRETLDQISNKLAPVLYLQEKAVPKPPERSESQLLSALAEVLEKAKDLRDSISL